MEASKNGVHKEVRTFLAQIYLTHPTISVILLDMEATPQTLLEAIKTYGDIDVALLEAADSRWPKGPACVHCGAQSPMFLKTRKIWKCSKCRKQFSFKAGTLLEDSPIGLDKWLGPLAFNVLKIA